MVISEDYISPFLPDKCVSIICDLINNSGACLQIKKHRKYKYGDFIVDRKTKQLKITINDSLDKYSFLITIIHELAHLNVWKNFKTKVKPHGNEWKQAFGELMQLFLNKNIFPTSIEQALKNYLINPTASTDRCYSLVYSLLPYSKGNMKGVCLESLPDGITFTLNNGKIMKKIGLLKKRYKCLCLNNNRMYSVAPYVEVFPVINK